MTYQSNSRFVVKILTILSSVQDSNQLHSLSFKQVFKYLFRFCALHDVEDQASVTLTVTLILSLHNLLSKLTQLLMLNLLKAYRIQLKKLAFNEKRYNLLYYLTLSCTASMLDSVI